MNKFFKDTDSREVQLLPVESRSREGHSNDTSISDNESKFVVMWYGKNNEGYSYQVVFNTVQHKDNNNYQVFLFNNNVYCWSGIFKSKTQFPPVWNREFGGIDYFDYQYIMDSLNELMKKNNKALFPKEISIDNQFVYLVKETPEKLEEIIKNNDKYEILALKAIAYLNNIGSHLNE